MPPFYLDTSALVKRYRMEFGSYVVDELIDQPPSGDLLFTSFLAVLEVTSAVHRISLLKAGAPRT